MRLNASQYTGHVTPAFHGIATPPGMGCIYDGGGGPPDDDDPDGEGKEEENA